MLLPYLNCKYFCYFVGTIVLEKPFFQNLIALRMILPSILGIQDMTMLFLMRGGTLLRIY